MEISKELIWSALGGAAALIAGWLWDRFMKRADRDEDDKRAQLAQLNNSIIALTIKIEVANKALESIPRIIQDLNALHRKVAELNVKVNQ